MDERSKRWEARLEWPMLMAAILVIPLLVIEQSASTDAWRSVATTLNWTIWIAFALEAAIMLTVVPRRWTWLRRHPLEALIVVFTIPILPASMQAFRAFRLLRLLRLALAARRVKTLFTAGGLSYAAVLSLLVILGGGAALRIAEPSLGLSFPDAAWWALTTATTVGYGDIYPHTEAGRAIAAVVMLVGIGFVALLTAAMAKMYFEPVAEAIEDEEDEIVVMLRDITARLDEIDAKIAARG